MKKILSIFLFLVFLFSFSSAIKISPTQQRFVVEKYETKCTNIWVLPHEDFVISSKWSLDGRGDLDRYNLSKKEIGLEMNWTYLSDGKYLFCFNPGRAGNFSGIVYFYSEKSRVEIGGWVDLEVRGTSFEKEVEEKINFLTGNAIKNENKNNLVLGGIFILLLIVLFFVVVFVKNSARGKI